MQAITTIGLDIAKSVFQVHGIDAEGNVILRRQLKRRYVLVFFQKLPSCLVGLEACASSHHWSRELQALGHTVRLMPLSRIRLLALNVVCCETAIRLERLYGSVYIQYRAHFL
jgi:transposase